MRFGSHEGGFVSLLTVMMFMILTTIVTVSFVTLTLGEQRQTLNDDLAKGAYEAAQAGIEDAKRAIRYCNNNPATCGTAQYTQACPGFYGTPAIASGLGLNPVGTTVPVGHASANQRYTCVTISNELSRFWGTLDPASDAAQTVFVPLKSATPFNSVKISWSLKESTTQVPSLGQTNPAAPAWNSRWPAMMRAMLINHPNASITETNVESRSTFLVPNNGGSTSATYSSMGSRIQTACSAGGTGAYTCSMTINGLASSREWYLQLAPYYRSAAFEVELFNGGTRVPMRDVGYMVDSTGAVADVYRRVQVLLGPDDVVSPSAAIQSGEKLCKNFHVTGSYAGSIDFNEICTP